MFNFIRCVGALLWPCPQEKAPGLLVDDPAKNPFISLFLQAHQWSPVVTDPELPSLWLLPSQGSCVAFALASITSESPKCSGKGIKKEKKNQGVLVSSFNLKISEEYTVYKNYTAVWKK